MKRIPRGAIAWALAVAAATALNLLLSRFLADNDIITAALVARDTSMIPVVMVAMLARLFLFLLAPGWALYIATLALLPLAKARYANARAPRRPAS